MSQAEGLYRPHVALSTSSLYPKGVPETFDAAQRLGYDSVEVLVTHERMSQLTHQLRDHIQEYQVPISTIHAPTLLFTQQVWGKAWTKIQMAAKLTEQVGAEVVVVHPPFRWQKKYARNFVQGVREVSRMTGIKISVENMYPWRVAGRKAVVYSPHYSPLGQDYDWVTWDFSHAATAHMDSLEAVKELGSRLGHIHLTDGSGTTWRMNTCSRATVSNRWLKRWNTCAIHAGRAWWALRYPPGNPKMPTSGMPGCPNPWRSLVGTWRKRARGPFPVIHSHQLRCDQHKNPGGEPTE